MHVEGLLGAVTPPHLLCMTVTYKQLSARWGPPGPLLKEHTSRVAEYNVLSTVELCPSPITSLKPWYKDNTEEAFKK